MLSFLVQSFVIYSFLCIIFHATFFFSYQCYQFQVILYDTLLHNYSLHVRTSQLEPVAGWWTAAYMGPGPYIPAKGRVPQANYHYGAYICNHLQADSGSTLSNPGLGDTFLLPSTSCPLVGAWPILLERNENSRFIYRQFPSFNNCLEN
jgi:hypothetical protein